MVLVVFTGDVQEIQHETPLGPTWTGFDMQTAPNETSEDLRRRHVHNVATWCAMKSWSHSSFIVRLHIEWPPVTFFQKASDGV